MNVSAVWKVFVSFSLVQDQQILCGLAVLFSILVLVTFLVIEVSLISSVVHFGFILDYVLIRFNISIMV